jgi:Ca2+-binding EF-hand superfamily protein
MVLESGFKRASATEVLRAADAFIEADIDGDGKLTQSEFHQWYSSSLRRHGHSLSDPDVAYKLRQRAEKFADPGKVPALAAKPPSVPQPTSRQLYQLGICAAVPFVAFGFLDNSIMIVAGDQIEASLGATLGLSAMAAAGLGNMCSDVVGIQAGSVVEQASGWLGLPQHGLTPSQMLSSTAKRVSTLAQMIGISVGCILGLAPLLFMDDAETKQVKKAFALIDRDRSGTISISELESCVTGLGFDLGRPALLRIYEEIDENRDRQISFIEFKHLVQKWKEGVTIVAPGPA